MMAMLASASDHALAALLCPGYLVWSTAESGVESGGLSSTVFTGLYGRQSKCRVIGWTICPGSLAYASVPCMASPTSNAIEISSLESHMRCCTRSGPRSPGLLRWSLLAIGWAPSTASFLERYERRPSQVGIAGLGLEA